MSSRPPWQSSKSFAALRASEALSLPDRCASAPVSIAQSRPLATATLPGTAILRILFASVLVQRGAGHGSLPTHARA
jgi:hypothetical protein